MSTISAFLDRMDDRISPVIVKELRQAVRGRFIVAVVLVFLAVQLLTMGIALLANAVTAASLEQSAAGRPVFLTIFGILMGTCLVCIPAYTGIRLAAERSDVNVDLLFITTLQPLAIILGKLGSAVILTLLIYSACVPFLAFTYFLRGIDFPSIFILLSMGLLAISVMVSLAITLATVPVTRPFKIMIGLGMLVMGFPMIPVTIALAFQFLQSSGGSLLGTSEFWITAAVVILFVSSGCAVLLTIATANVTPPAANRAFPVRLMLTLFWVITGSGVSYLAYKATRAEPLIAWMVFTMIVLILSLLTAVSEKRTLGARVLRDVPTSFPARLAAFPFFGGALSGLTWTAIMFVATMLVLVGVGSLVGRPSSNDHLEAAAWLGDATLFLFGYAFAGIALRERGIFKRIPPGRTWVLVFLMAIFGTAVPIFAWVIFGGSEPFGKTLTPWMFMPPLTNPDEVHPARVVFGALVLATLMFIQRKWIWRQLSAFRRA